jgi:adenine-specific DNA-methyltransferase
MVERLKEMHRLLKPTGSIYAHLDWHAVHYVKVEMDKIFGYDNFVNEII